MGDMEGHLTKDGQTIGQELTNGSGDFLLPAIRRSSKEH
jgi:hypothetical protein